MSVEITVQEFKDYFDRGQFVYGTDAPDIRDKDITASIAEMEAVINGDIYPEDSICTQAKLYLSAHFLQKDLESVSSGGQSTYNQTSRSADGISESLSIPEWMNQGELAFYATTYYGQKWLILTKPYTDGAVFSVPGATQVAARTRGAIL